VLLADDSAIMRKIIRGLLDEVGVKSPTEACDGAEAIALFKSGQFDLVLSDWNMPNKSGLDVIREIRALGSDVPLIMITTEAEKARMALAIHAGASDYMVKPFDRTKLTEMLQRHVRKRQSKATSTGWSPEFTARRTVRSAWSKDP
jgi:two-component system chemotaxis response regulator CheY